MNNLNKLILTILCLLQTGQSLATIITPHVFEEYPRDRIEYLDDLFQTDKYIFNNCLHCITVPFPAYLIAGFDKLIHFKSNKRESLKPGESAIVVDYHFNYAYVFNYQTKIINIEKIYPISGGVGGLSNKRGSGATPAGVHVVYKKQHPNARLGEIVWARPYSLVGNIIEPTQGDQWFEPSIITTRRIRLEGLESINTNSKARSILFHGTHEEGYIGMQKSGGCLRMLNVDVVELFNKVKKGTLVNIVGDTEDHVGDGDIIWANNKPKKIYDSDNACEKLNFFKTKEVFKILESKDKKFPDNDCKARY